MFENSHRSYSCLSREKLLELTAGSTGQGAEVHSGLDASPSQGERTVGTLETHVHQNPCLWTVEGSLQDTERLFKLHTHLLIHNIDISFREQTASSVSSNCEKKLPRIISP